MRTALDIDLGTFNFSNISSTCYNIIVDKLVQQRRLFRSSTTAPIRLRAYYRLGIDTNKSFVICIYSVYHSLLCQLAEEFSMTMYWFIGSTSMPAGNIRISYVRVSCQLNFNPTFQFSNMILCVGLYGKRVIVTVFKRRLTPVKGQAG